MKQYDAILRIALDLTASLGAEDRYRRLLEAVRLAVPCDAATLMRVDGDVLFPLATYGLAPEAAAHPYRLGEHPRLEIICSSESPVHFPADPSLPDPFDGQLASDPHGLADVHACLGLPLRVEGELVGVLTADAVAPHAFDELDPRFLDFLAALAGAALRTNSLIEAMESDAHHLGLVTRDLVRAAHEREGGELIGDSPALRQLRKEIDLVATSDFSVLVTGETGVGKELVVREIHARSSRREAPLIYVNCAALPESIAESELFGHVKGAFTGATTDRAGKFEVADKGSLFLDEIGELPLLLQPKLLRVLQDGEIQRVGADRQSHVSVRVLAATNRSLEEEVRAGRFRADLFHRLNVYPIRVPALRDHEEDILVLAGHFCDETRQRLGLGPVRMLPGARSALVRYAWPGNVRELENVLSRALLRAAGEGGAGEPIQLSVAHLGGEFDADVVKEGPTDPELPRSFREAVHAYRRHLIERAVARAGGNWAAAARALGLDRSNLHHMAKRLGLRD